MNESLQIFLGIGIFIYLALILHLLRKKEINLRYSLIWLFSVLIMLILVVFPGIVEFLAKIIGIVDPVNVVFVFEGVFVLLILISLTGIVSHLNEKNRKLIQTVALQEKRIRVLEESNDQS